MKPSLRKTKTTTHADRMRFVIDLARRNITRGTGGPFAAAIFDLKTGRLLASGVNRVVVSHDPTAHAEIIAIRAACRRMKTYRLRDRKLELGLYTSAEPCGMCCTALIWAGIKSLYCGAGTSDVEAIGFDEGLKPRDWPRRLEERKIHVVRKLLRKEATALLREYGRKGGVIYNG